MSVELPVIAMLVAEHAAGAVHALLRVIEGPAVLRLELLVVLADGIVGELFLAMSESALGLVATLGSLNPVLAEFSFVLAVSVVLNELWGGHLVSRLLHVAPLVFVDATLGVELRRGLGRHHVRLQVGGLEGGRWGEHCIRGK